MLFQVIEENGQKKIKPLTADAGAGNPVGTIIPMYKKSSPSGYLYCDGSTFDETAYPLLYAYLGTNVLPDYREFALVGAEQNTTSSNIADHDIYTEGQEKDDQLQDHAHNNTWSRRLGTYFEGVTSSDYEMQDNPLVSHEGVYGARTGTVTRGKRKAVYFYIKATSGLSENAQDNVINTLNEQRSYSTEEHLTGRKWIDGKPIYSKTVDCGMLPNATEKTVAHNIANIGNVIKVSGTASRVGATLPLPYVVAIDANGFDFRVNLFVTPTVVNITTYMNMTEYTTTYVTLEYTKTTD